MIKISAMAVILSFAPITLVYGVGIGDLFVQSHLDQPFKAQISLQDIEELNVDDIRVKLASLEDFERADIDFSDFLGNLTFKVVRNSKNDATIQIKSDVPVQDPYLSFILEIFWGGGHLLKEFSALIDPIELKQIPVPVPVLEPQVQSAPAEPFVPVEPKPTVEPQKPTLQKQSLKEPLKLVPKPQPLAEPSKKSVFPAPAVQAAKKPLELLSPTAEPEHLNMNQRLVMVEEILDTLTQNNRMLKEQQTEYKAENESLVALLKLKEQEIMRLKMLPPPEKPVNLLSIILTGIVLGFTVISLVFMMRLKKNKIKIRKIII